MWLEALAIPVCAILMLIKGGQHGFLRRKVTNPYLYKMLDGKILSTLGFGLLCLCFMPPLLSLTAALGWLLGVAPSIGEDIAEQRSGNWKPFFQRGTFMGASIALGCWNPAFILAGMLSPVFLWISDKWSKDWYVKEALEGAAIGLVLAVS